MPAATGKICGCRNASRKRPLPSHADAEHAERPRLQLPSLLRERHDMFDHEFLGR